jgi:hypothetical protein
LGIRLLSRLWHYPPFAPVICSSGPINLGKFRAPSHVVSIGTEAPFFLRSRTRGVALRG